MNSNRAIVIVGAPRSGTSLLQKFLRESPGTISVPHESSIIWNKVIHPCKNHWEFEGTVLSLLSEEDKECLRQEFQNKAMTDKNWKLWSRIGIMKQPWAAKIVRWVYPQVFPLISKIRTSKKTKGRLVEKTVHGGLWMDLIDEILEKPIFVHITRDGFQSIKSITNAWDFSERFGCYQVPKEISYQKKEFKNTWCFPLIKNWEEICDRPIYKIATFQWLQIQKNILEYAKENIPKNRYICIKLEDLVENPKALLELARELNLPWSDYFEKLLLEIPKVNASKGSRIILSSREENWIKKEIKDVQLQLGY